MRHRTALKAAAAALAILVCGLLYSCSSDGNDSVSWENAGYGVQTPESTKQEAENPGQENPGQESGQADDVPQLIYVYVCGSVNNPGVYGVEAGSRAYMLIDMAGGFTPDAAAESVSMAEPVNDGQTLFVPSVESQQGENIDSSGQTVSSRININSATKEQLMTLKGIGEARALDIIDYRNSCGGFKKIEDIMNVSGIKEAAYAKIKDDICVR